MTNIEEKANVILAARTSLCHDALVPYMSRETLEYHHDKHHLAYINNGNNLAKGTEWENKPVEEVVKGTFGKNEGLFNNAGQHYNHIHFWKWMKPGGGGNKIPGELEKKDLRRSWLRRQYEGRIHSGRRHAIRLRLVLACGERWQDRSDEDAQRREPPRAGRQADIELISTKDLLWVRGHFGKLGSIRAGIRYLVRDDQMMLRIHVADDARAPPAGRH